MAHTSHRLICGSTADFLALPLGDRAFASLASCVCWAVFLREAAGPAGAAAAGAGVLDSDMMARAEEAEKAGSASAVRD